MRESLWGRGNFGEPGGGTVACGKEAEPILKYKLREWKASWEHTQKESCNMFSSMSFFFWSRIMSVRLVSNVCSCSSLFFTAV